MKGRHFIIFGEDFNRHPHALEHILRPLFADNQFLWVETIGLRTPKFSLYDFKRILEKLKGWLLPKSITTKGTIPKNIIIIKPFMIPLNQYRLIRLFNRWNVTRKVHAQVLEKKLTQIISIASVPNASDYIGHFNESLKIYYCVDEFSLWPGLDLNLVKTLEEKLMANVDLIIATSDFLANTKKLHDRTTPVITHGVDFKHFNIKTKQMGTPLKLCYFGLFDERSDQNILAEIVNQIPDSELHIFGTVVCDISKLQKINRIQFHGNITYDQLPESIKEMDIFLLPYVRSELTNNINPLKLKEYLATERPVIATALPEVKKLSNYLFIANDAMDFITTIKGLRNKSIPFNSQKIMNYVKTYESWEAKTELLSEIILKREKEVAHSSVGEQLNPQ